MPQSPTLVVSCGSARRRRSDRHGGTDPDHVGQPGLSCIADPNLGRAAGAGFTFTGSTGTEQIRLSPCTATASFQRVCREAPSASIPLGARRRIHSPPRPIRDRPSRTLGALTRARPSHRVDRLAELPANFAGGSLSAPFSFSGLFRLTDDQTGFVRRVNLFGSGIATVTFGPVRQSRLPQCVRHAVRALRFCRRRRDTGAYVTAAPRYGPLCHRGCEAATNAGLTLFATADGLNDC